MPKTYLYVLAYDVPSGVGSSSHRIYDDEATALLVAESVLQLAETTHDRRYRVIVTDKPPIGEWVDCTKGLPGVVFRTVAKYYRGPWLLESNGLSFRVIDSTRQVAVGDTEGMTMLRAIRIWRLRLP